MTPIPTHTRHARKTPGLVATPGPGYLRFVFICCKIAITQPQR
jgi:hypothetical protein